MWLFAHRLALALGEADVDGMLAGISATQLRRWMAYATLEPFGEERADLRAGVIAATVANVHRRSGRAYKPSDFMPKFARRQRQQTREEEAAVWAAYLKAHREAYGG